jgi:large subunit ribosomal protein L6
MSRIGKLPIKIPAGVNITNNGLDIIVKGKFGTLQNQLPDSLSIQQTDSNLIVTLQNYTREGRALHGLYRTLINNMVIGVSEQFQINLSLKGVGYRATVQGKSIILNLGYSHPVEMEIPEGISVEVVKNVDINIKSCDKEQLGLFAAKIRAWRSPEPYKGKGIIYEGEIVKRKAGKSGKK